MHCKALFNLHYSDKKFPTSNKILYANMDLTFYANTNTIPLGWTLVPSNEKGKFIFMLLQYIIQYAKGDLFSFVLQQIKVQYLNYPNNSTFQMC